MKYFTKKWYELGQRLYLSEGIKIIEDKKYNNEEIEEICKEEYERQLHEFLKEEEKCYNEPPENYLEIINEDEFDYRDVIMVSDDNDTIIEPKSKEEAIKFMRESYEKELEEFKNRPKFNKEETENFFEEIHTKSLEFQNDGYPDFVIKNVDKRFLALNLMPKNIYEKLEQYDRNNLKEYEQTEKMADKDLKNQNIPNTILDLFIGFHDGNILKIENKSKDIFLLVKLETGEEVELELKNGEILENEAIKYLKQEDVYCIWLYHELYRNNNGYELHIMVETEDGLKYITIKCKEIKKFITK